MHSKLLSFLLEMIEINTLLKFEDKVGSEKKSHFEIKFSTIIKVNDEIKKHKDYLKNNLKKNFF